MLKRDATRLLLAERLGPGSHKLVLYLASSDANYDRWKTPEEAIKLKGLIVDDGSRVEPGAEGSKLAGKRVIFFGDSITEGAWVLGKSNHVVEGKYVDWVAHSRCYPGMAAPSRRRSRCRIRDVRQWWDELAEIFSLGNSAATE